MKILHKIHLVLGVAVSMLGVSPVVYSGDLLQEIKQRGELRIGVEGGYPPFVYRDEVGRLQGFDVEVAKAVADKLGVKPKFLATEWSGIIGGLQSAKFDVIVNQMAITPMRQKALDFSTPYVYSSVQLIQRADDAREFASVSALAGKKVGVVLGTTFADTVKSQPGVIMKTYAATPETLHDLADGRIDATLNDKLLLPYLLKNNHLPLRAGAPVPNTDVQIAIPYRKGNPEFGNSLNEALVLLREEGTLKRLSMKWLGSDATTPILN